MKTTKTSKRTNPVALVARNMAGAAVVTALLNGACGNFGGAVLILGLVALPTAAFWLAAR